MSDNARQSVAEKVERTKNGRPKSYRPDGSEYSKDPKERYQQLVEDGKMGGELAKVHGSMGGRPRKVSAQELVAEKAREEAETIWEALRDGLVNGNIKQKREAAQAILDVEEKHAKRIERQQDRAEGLGKDKIIQMLVDKLTGEGPTARALRARMEEVVDAEVVEPAELPSGH